MISSISPSSLARVRTAALDQTKVEGLTHSFYRYPARFSPAFASEAISCFSEPGDVVLDPYMGGGTTLVEAKRLGRIAIGNDINTLAGFVTRVKTTPLRSDEISMIGAWAEQTIPALSYRNCSTDQNLPDDYRLRNMQLPNARFIRKIIAQALESASYFESFPAQEFARCAILRTSQWALDGRLRGVSSTEFRERLKKLTHEMLDAMETYKETVESCNSINHLKPILTEGCASHLSSDYILEATGKRVSLVVTSPPYPGVHVLYHRWQIDGRKESPAPYWIAGCHDGAGSSYYTFGDRNEEGHKTYFERSLATLSSIRSVMKCGGYFVQMIAFSDPARQLPKYLKNMSRAGFAEQSLFEPTESGRQRRVWRNVPGRKWHANLKGRTFGSREVVLVHQAV